MLADARRAAIVERLRPTGSVTVAELEEQFGVSSDDRAPRPRRARAPRLVRRTHGGAVLPGVQRPRGLLHLPPRGRRDAKRALAEAAAAGVQEGESLFVDSSTTGYHVARALLDRGVPSTVITNSLPVMELVAAATRAA